MSKVKEKQVLSVIKLPLSVNKEDLFKAATHDRVLINGIIAYRKKLEEQGIEIFKREENILATEDGYYCAVYEEDLRNAPGGIDNPIPFKGKDGRLKVDVVKESGETVSCDLADLVAMKHCPNPKKYKRTWFVDGNPENVTADNIYWVSDLRYKLILFRDNILNIIKYK